jgi:autotransporter-associated beta strand protein
MKPKAQNRLLLALLPIASFTVPTPSAIAATRFWDGGTVDIASNGNGSSGGGNGTWNTTLLNWDAGNSPHVAWNNAANDTADINGGSQTLTLGTDITVGGIIAKAGASGVVISEGTGLNTLNLGFTTTTLSVAASTTTARSLSINAVVTGTNLSVVGPTGTAGGSVNLNRVNTYTGNTSVNNTTLRIGNSGAAGQLNSGNYTGTINLVSASSFLGYASSLNQTLGGVISGLGALTKGTSASVLTLTATNTYSGATNITGGTLALTGTGAVNNSSGITLNGSTAKLLPSGSTPVTPTVTLTQGTLTGSGTVNTVNVGDATGGIVSNNDGIAGVPLTIGTLTFNGAATVNTFGNTAVPLVVTALATNAAGAVTLNPTAESWTSGSSYDLISYGGGSVGGAGSGQFTLGTVTGKSARQTATLVDTGTTVAVQIGGTTDFPFWVGDTDTQWDTTTPNNWRLVTAGTYTDFIPTDEVLFNDNASPAGPVAVSINAADVTATKVTFDNSTKDYLLASTGGFGLSTPSLVKNGSGTATFGTITATATSATVNNGTLAQTGGTATVGTLQIGGTAAAPGTTAALALTGGTFTATTFDGLSGGDNMTSAITLGGTAEVTLPAFPTNAKGTGATATITFDSTTGFLSPLAASTSYLPAGTFDNAYLTTNGAKFNVPSGKNITIGQVLENAVSAAGSLTKDGTGVLTLSGANTFTGTTTVNDGILQLADLAALGGSSGITMTGGTLRPTLSNVTLTAPITTSGDVLIGAPTNNIGNQAINPFVLNGAIGGTGNVTFSSSLNSNVNQTVTLGAAASYSGTTLLHTSGGTASQIIVRLGVDNALPVTTVVTIDGRQGAGSGRYAEINLSGFNQTLAGLTNTPRADRVQRIVNSDVSAAATLTINNTDDYTFSGNLGSGANGSVSSIPTPGSTNGSNFGLTKSGSGTFTLTGNNPFYGPTTVTAGILSLGNSLALQRSPLDSLNSIAGDATNGLQTTVTALTLGGLTGDKNLATLFEPTSGGYSGVTALTLNPETGASHAYSGGIADGAAGMTLTKSGAGTQSLSGTNTYTGQTTVAAGTLALVGGSQASPIVVNNLAALGFTLDSATTSTATVVFDAGSTVAVTGTPAPETSYTLLTTTATITGTPSLAPAVPGFELQVDGSNTLKLVPLAAGSYSSWQAANGTDQAENLDHDNDGVPNGVEFFLGGTTDTTGFTPLPGVTDSSGTLSVTWTKGATYLGTYGTGFVVETSDTLAGPWTTEIADPNPGFTVTFPSSTEVKYTFPAGARNFARLKVTGP